jgi:dihydrofolate reductase
MSVIANLAMSVDGFIADEQDGCDDLFGFYFDGDVEVVLSQGWPAFRMWEPSASLMRSAVGSVGATVVGRRLFDLTNGWGGHPGGEVPMVVLTHSAPTEYPRDGVPIHFVSGAASAVALAQSLAGSRNVTVAGASATRECLDAGVLDVIDVSLVPVVLGAGIPWLAGVSGPVRLSDPEVVPARGVTHLRYRVLR